MSKNESSSGRTILFGYLALVILGCLLFLPTREGLSLSYAAYKNWWCYFAFGYTLPITIASYIAFFGEGRTTRIFMSFIASATALIIFGSLFGAIQWVNDNFVSV